MHIRLIRRGKRIFQNIRPCQAKGKPRKLLHHAETAQVLLPCAAAKYNLPARCHIIFKKFHSLLSQYFRVRVKQHRIARKLPLIYRVIQINIVVHNMLLLKCNKQRVLARALYSSMPVVNLRIPDIIIVAHNRHPRLIDCTCDFLHPAEFFMYLL